MSNPPVRLERDGAVAHIVLARPEAGNAVSLALCRAFADAVETCAADPFVRAVLVRAEGPNFCVGGDLQEFRRQGADRPAHLSALAHPFHAAQARLMTMAAPEKRVTARDTAGRSCSTVPAASPRPR